jgi:histidyl-tRNA synthetase
MTDLRAAGVSADADFMERGLKSQMKQADRLAAHLVLILGKDELQRGEVTFRDLAHSNQWTVSLAEMIAKVKDFLASRRYDG